MRVLHLLAEYPRGISVAQVASELGVGRTVAYRLVSTLVEHRFAQRDEDGLVRLGWGAVALARSAGPQLRAQALPILRELADAVEATAHLTVTEGEQALAIAVVEPRWTDFHVGYREGSRHLLTQGAAGKAILVARTGKLELVRSEGELQPGAFGVAIAVRPGSFAPAAGASPESRLQPVEMSIGVVSLQPLPMSADRSVRNAAHALEQKLFG